MGIFWTFRIYRHERIQNKSVPKVGGRMQTKQMQVSHTSSIVYQIKNITQPSAKNLQETPCENLLNRLGTCEKYQFAPHYNNILPSKIQGGMSQDS